jgi:RNA polymerase sigma factor (sigma-70 family)
MQSTIEVANKKWKHFVYPEFSGYPKSSECPSDWIEDNHILESNWNSFLLTSFQEVPNSIERLSLLSAKETRELFIRFNYCKKMISLGYESWTEAWESIRCKIFYANMGLVSASIRMTRGVVRSDRCDLINEGGIALLRTIDLFNISYGYQFSTYGIVSIRRALNRFVDARGKNACRFYSCDYNFSKVAQDSGPDPMDKVLLRETISKYLKPNELEVLRLRYELDLNVVDIGNHMGISRGRAKLLLDKVMTKLSRLMN